MDPMSQIVVLNIGNVVAWLAAIYVKGALRGLIGHVCVSVLGAYLGGYLSFKVFPQFDGPGLVVAAFVGAATLLYVTRLRSWHIFTPGR